MVHHFGTYDLDYTTHFAHTLIQVLHVVDLITIHLSNVIGGNEKCKLVSLMKTSTKTSVVQTLYTFLYPLLFIIKKKENSR